MIRLPLRGQSLPTRKGICIFILCVAGAFGGIHIGNKSRLRAAPPAGCHSVTEPFRVYRASLVAQMVKNLPTMQETQVQSLGSREDTLEKSMDTVSSILAWRTPWTEEPDGLQSMGITRVGHD